MHVAFVVALWPIHASVNYVNVGLGNSLTDWILSDVIAISKLSVNMLGIDFIGSSFCRLLCDCDVFSYIPQGHCDCGNLTIIPVPVRLIRRICVKWFDSNPDRKVHGANMGPTWILSAPDGPLVGRMNFAIRDSITKSIRHYAYAMYTCDSLQCWGVVLPVNTQ